MKITYYVAASLDGFIARANGSVDWLEQINQSGDDYGYADYYNSVDALVMGRVTYEQVLGSGDWPYPDKPTFILTSHSLATDHNDVKLVATINQLIDKLNQSEYNHIWLVGGGKTASTFLQAGILDELIVSYIPIALGSGIPLFSAPAVEAEIEIIGSDDHPGGVVQITYRIKF